MDNVNALEGIGLSVVAAAAFALPAYLLGIPLLVAYLLAGIILGPHLGFGFIQDAESIATVSETGLIMLMFLLGLEIDVRKITQAGKPVVANGIVQFLGCFALAYGFFYACGYRSQPGSYLLIYLSVAASLSSTLLVVKILSDKMEIDTLPSRITLGVLVIQDLWAITFLAIQPNLSDPKLSALLISLASSGVLVIGSWLVAKFILPKVFDLVGKQPEMLLLVALGWCFGVCGAANFLHLSSEMGALIAGVSIAAFPYHVEVSSKISSLRDFFITLFFVALGLRIPEPTSQVLMLTALIVVFALVSRILTVFPVTYFFRYGNRASLFPALNLSQISEFSLILVTIGVGLGHISDEILSAFVLALSITVLISSFLIPGSHGIYKALNPLLEKIGFKDEVLHSKKFKREKNVTYPLVFLGFFRNASSLLFEINSRFSKDAIKQLLVIDLNPEAHKKLHELGIHCKYGDVSNPDTLKHLGLENSKLLVSTIPDSSLRGTSNLNLLRVLKKLAPQALIIVTADTLSSARQMYVEGADYVFIPRLIGAHYLADIIDRYKSGDHAIIRAKAAEFIASRQEVLP